MIKRGLLILLLLGPAMTSWGQAVSGLPAPSVQATDTQHNASVAFTTGSIGDTSCPTPATGSTYLCLQSGALNISTNGAAYTPLPTASLTGSIGQMMFYSAANVPGASSAVMVSNTAAGGQINFSGSEYHLGTGPSTPTTVTLNGAITSSATSATVNTSVGIPSTCSVAVFCVGYLGTNVSSGELASLTGVPSSTSLTLGTRGMFGTTGQAQSNLADVMFVSYIKADTPTSLPWQMHVYNGSSFYTPSPGLLNYARGGAVGTYISNLYLDPSTTAFTGGLSILNGLEITSDSNNGALLYSNGTQFGYITPTGVIRSYGNQTTLTANNPAITQATLTATNLVFPNIFAVTGTTNYTNKVTHGHCEISWQNTAGTQAVVFGIGVNQTPGTGGLNVTTRSYNTSPPPIQYTPISASSTGTAITASLTPSAASTVTQTIVDFGYTLANNSTNTITIYADVVSGGSLQIMAGSDCEWRP